MINMLASSYACKLMEKTGEIFNYYCDLMESEDKASEMNRLRNNMERVQCTILIEECSELIKALAKYERRPDEHEKYLKNVKEEMAHVILSLEVVSKVLNISEDDIIEEILFKEKVLNDTKMVF